jgi:hypothetical protein
MPVVTTIAERSFRVLPRKRISPASSAPTREMRCVQLRKGECFIREYHTYEDERSEQAELSTTGDALP